MLTLIWLIGAGILVGLAGLQPSRAMVFVVSLLALLVAALGLWTEVRVSGALTQSTAGKVWTSPAR